MFDFEKYSSLVISFFAENILIGVGLGAVLLVFFYKKPAETIKFIGFCCLLVTTLYILSLLSHSGTQGVMNKRDAATRSETELMR
ncbi:MAG: hypothetical protein V2I36_14070 [Desulfopila sp.]|jgi:hypothetical protein|nr:hypothetical protein [Desulfopila sp.]